MDDIYFLLMRIDPMKLSPDVKRRHRQSIKLCNDPLATSLRSHKWKEFWVCGTDPWRRAYDKEDWESWREYVIMPDFPDESDEEIQRSIDELEVRICSQYDCTGQPFSRYIHWKRTKAGIVIVRHMGLDV